VGLYAKYVIPRIVNFTCRAKPITRQRAKVVPLANGRVLELGIGSGLNLPFYDRAKVSHVWGLDPSAETWRIGQRQRSTLGFDVEFIEGSAEKIPLDSGSADTVVVTYTLCTIPDVARCLADIRRVLRPEGELIFCEHGAAPDESVRRWQNRLNPLWRRIGGGCNLNREIPLLLEQAGFTIRTLETMYIPGWRPACFNYWGTAVAGPVLHRDPFRSGIGSGSG